MQIVERRSGDVTILEVQGRLTRNDGYGQIKDHVNRLVQQGGAHVLLSLRDVSYMDSTCVGEIVAAFITVRNAGGKFRLLVNSSGHIRELLATVKLDRVLGMFEMETDALRSFAS